MKYLNPFDNGEIASYTVKTFGESVRQRREQLDISLRQMSKRLNMSAMYLSEIERGLRPAPLGSVSGVDYLSILAKELCLTDSQKEVYTLMAKVSHLNPTYFVDNYFINNLTAFEFFLKAIENNFNNADWEKMYQLMFEQK